LALAVVVSACLGCMTAGDDRCAGVTCAAGRECVNGVCVSRDLPRPDWFAGYPDWSGGYDMPGRDGFVDAAADAAADGAGADGAGADTAVVDAAAVDAAKADAASCAPGTKTLVVKVHVEGLSYLRIQNNQAWWYHVTYAAPGLSTSPASPTTINAVDWTPTWPFSSGNGMHCACESAKFDLCKAGVALGASPTFSSLKKISGPGVVVLAQAPIKGSGYRAAVLVHDTPYGSNWYEFKITFK
jgi:hypothetical protein